MIKLLFTSKIKRHDGNSSNNYCVCEHKLFQTIKTPTKCRGNELAILIQLFSGNHTSC